VGKKPRILFLCTGNSCRSQMAEGWARALFGDAAEALSAGTDPKPLDPRAVRAMAEAGVDISGHRPKSVREFLGQTFDLVATVCDDARESCPVFPGPGEKVHRSFDDPPRLAEGAANEEAVLAAYRRVRDEIRDFIRELGKRLPAPRGRQERSPR